MQTNVRRKWRDEQMFVYYESREAVDGGIGGEPMVAVLNDGLDRGNGPHRLRLFDGVGGGCRTNGYKGYPVIKALRNVIISGTALILLLSAYSVGASISSSRSNPATTANSQVRASYLSYTVKPGDSAWSIASEIASNPSQVPAIVNAITTLDGGTVLVPGTVLHIAN